MGHGWVEHESPDPDLAYR